MTIENLTSLQRNRGC
jgi:hypothetical protein